MEGCRRFCAARLVSALLILVVATSTAAEETRVAVASNFTDAIREVAGRFEQRNGHQITPVFGSTGKHYAQIKHGAPFHAFFAADVKRPRLLEEQGIGMPGSRFTYAIGKLVLWSPKANYVDPSGQVLKDGEFRYLALANPKHAPYGRAAQEVLEASGLWPRLQRKLVRGENIGQTFQFVKTGNAELGFIARSQLKRPGQPASGSSWAIPQGFYAPIEQQAILLKDNAAARDILTFVRGDEAKEIIRAYGYGTP